jgi:hypothetical protein
MRRWQVPRGWRIARIVARGVIAPFPSIIITNINMRLPKTRLPWIAGMT